MESTIRITVSDSFVESRATVWLACILLPKARPPTARALGSLRSRSSSEGEPRVLSPRAGRYWINGRMTMTRSTRCQGSLKWAHLSLARYSFEVYSATKSTIIVQSQMSRNSVADGETLIANGMRMIGMMASDRKTMNLSDRIESMVSLRFFRGSASGTKSD